MSTPITDAAYEAVRSFINEEQAVDALMEMRETSRKLERENAALKQRILDDNKAYGCELMDPSGTIWDHAKRLQDENAALRADKERLVKTASEVMEYLILHLRVEANHPCPENLVICRELQAAIDAARKEAQP